MNNTVISSVIDEELQIVTVGTIQLYNKLNYDIN